LQIAMLAVGDELVDGRFVDTNSQTLARSLARIGHTLREIRVVRDEPGAMRLALDDLGARHEHLFVSGGLGITRDDLTRAVVADWLGEGLVEDSIGVEAIKTKLEERGGRFTEELRGHALRPGSSTGIPNFTGLALGFSAHHAVLAVTVHVLPGVPHELVPMCDWVVGRLQTGMRRQRLLRVQDLTERDVEQRLRTVTIPAEVTLGLVALSGPIELSLTRYDGDEAGLDALAEEVSALFEAHLVGVDTTLERRIAQQLTQRGETLATAESCTGGLIASLITDVPGSSVFFLEGVVSYANASKIARLGVAAETLERFGAVSPQTVGEMAQGVRRALGADWSVATSGIAGPTGGTVSKPVGRVYFAVAGPSGTTHDERTWAGRTREVVKRHAAAHALLLLSRAIAAAE